MKKSLESLAAVSLVVITFLWSAVASADMITVTKPSGGSLLKNHTTTIEWTYTGTWAGKAVKITLFKDGVKVGDIKSNSDPFVMNAGGTGSFSCPWTVGAYIGGTADAGSGYTIRVKVVNEPTTDDSATFGITNYLMLKPELMRKFVLVQTAKSNLRVSFTLTPANCGTQAGTACHPPTHIYFPITVRNVGEGAARTKQDGQSISYRVYLYFLGQDGNRNPGNDWNMQWWGSISPSQLPAGGTKVISSAGGSSGTLGDTGANLRSHDFGMGKWRLKAVIDDTNNVEETNESDNETQVEFWVQ